MKKIDKFVNTWLQNLPEKKRKEYLKGIAFMQISALKCAIEESNAEGYLDEVQEYQNEIDKWHEYLVANDICCFAIKQDIAITLPCMIEAEKEYQQESLRDGDASPE